MKIKHIYLTFLALTALILSACSSDSPDENSGKGDEVTFTVKDNSRASVTSSIQEFTVFGDVKKSGDTSKEPVVLLNKTNVKFTGSIWTYDNIQYWVPKMEHSFVAISPSSILEEENSHRYSGSQLSFRYSVPLNGGILSSTDKVSDILVSTHRRVYGEIGTTTPDDHRISFRFNHILSLVNLSPAFDDNLLAPDDYITFYGIEVSGVKTTAQVNIMPAPMQSTTQTDDMVVGISAEESQTFTLTLPTPVKVQNNGVNVNLFADADPLIMIPQIFEPENDAKITFSYTIADDPTMRYVSLTLTNQKWQSGKSYLYKFSIERSGMNSVTCGISGWNDVKGDEISVD